MLTNILDNPINQQIAIKTIKKLKFSVSAVWNGQEALDYLSQPESPEHPRPDVILMDVQMPVMDGYIATHTLRHTAPFVNNKQIQNTPIVAMTASAIQGDREKCENAGMNDYLAKPVKGKILEKMLVKWANARRTGSMQVGAGLTLKLGQGPRDALGRDIDVTSPEETIPKVLEPLAPLPSPAIAEAPPAANPEKLVSKLNELDFVSTSALARSSETPESRALQHLNNEEKAIQLRNEQLIESGNDPKEQFVRGGTFSDEKGGARAINQKLTRENVEKLVEDAKEDGASSHTRASDDDTSSLAVGVDVSVRPRNTRPSLGERKMSDSERTVLADQ